MSQKNYDRYSYVEYLDLCFILKYFFSGVVRTFCHITIKGIKVCLALENKYLKNNTKKNNHL